MVDENACFESLLAARSDPRPIFSSPNGKTRTTRAAMEPPARTPLHHIAQVLSMSRHHRSREYLSREARSAPRRVLSPPCRHGLRGDGSGTRTPRWPARLHLRHRGERCDEPPSRFVHRRTRTTDVRTREPTVIGPGPRDGDHHRAAFVNSGCSPRSGGTPAPHCGLTAIAGEQRG
jgi:hypothetical protein